MQSKTKHDILLPPEINYIIPGINEVKCISHKQTLSLVLGSCVSTVFIAKSDKYYLAANHIVIATPKGKSIVTKKSASQQVDEILDLFINELKIEKKNIKCLHLVGAGSHNPNLQFNVHHQNVTDSLEILQERKYVPLFQDTGSYFVSNFSIYKNNLSVFIENRDIEKHISYTINIDEIINVFEHQRDKFPTSGLESFSTGFEHLIDQNAITFITGAKAR